MRKEFRIKLKKLFSPKSIAVVGASENFEKLGFHVMRSLIKGGYRGVIYPINPHRKTIWGINCYPSLLHIPENVDLAVIVVPSKNVPEVLKEGGKRGISGAVVISSGFKEANDKEGKALEDEMRHICEVFQIPVIGPNTFGFVNLTDGVNASFTYELSLLKKGCVTLISQSGGVCHVVGFMAMEKNVGMAKIVSLGNRLNIDFPEAVEYFLEMDNSTKVILLHIEGMENPRRFFEVLEKSKVKKPLIAYKAGKNEKGDVASKFHTGSLAGNYRIWKGAFRQWGIFEVEDLEEFLDTAKVLAACGSLEGKRIAVLSGQAGPGIIAADVLEREGLKLASFSPKTQRIIDRILPPFAIKTNPVDMGPLWYSPKTIFKILKIVSQDENVDGILFINVFASANLKLASEMIKILNENEPFQKPVITCLCAPKGVWDEEIQLINGKKNIAIISTPERAARAIANLYKVYRLLKILKKK
ncbi:MAG: CoA-binding protein [Nitrososphaerota archaeon]